MALQKIFKPFEQADNTVTRRYGGTGLGLSISKKFANAMSGDVTVASVQGEGSTFTITLPLGSLVGVRLIGSDEGRQLVEQQLQKNAEVEQVCLKPSRILLIDDGESNRQLASLVLRRLGMQVVEGTNGQEAVDLAQASKFDLILMDMQMPVMDGYTAAGVLRERGLTLPIVALTANAMHGDEDKCKSAGCSHFLTKPIDINALVAILAETLGTIEGASPRHSHLLASEPAPDLKTSQSVLSASRKSSCILSQTGARRPVVSVFPSDDPEFRAIIVKFTESLLARLPVMLEAFEKADFESLSDHAHWLKGAGGTVGFNEFTEPARRLESLAKDQAKSELEPVLAEIIEIAKAIHVDSLPESIQPVLEKV